MVKDCEGRGGAAPEALVPYTLCLLGFQGCSVVYRTADISYIRLCTVG